MSVKALGEDTLRAIKNWGNGKFYTKPSTGVPATDLSEAVRSSLALADSAVQPSALEGTLKYFNARPYIPTNLKPVGGKIFYVDDTSTSEYLFFDTDGNTITDPIGAGSTPAFYMRTFEGNGKDKYYVYHDQVFTSKRWTYYDPETIVEGDPRYNANWSGYAFESLGTSRDIGQGKLNTQKVMEKDGGAYVQANSNGYPTVWYKIKEMRDSKIGGCDDWFLPSDKELEELRKAIGFVRITTSDDPIVLSASAITGGTIAGVADGQTHYKDYLTTRTCYPSANAFLSQYLWASSEYSAVYSWCWSCTNQDWSYSYKGTTLSVVGVRAF